MFDQDYVITVAVEGGGDGLKTLKIRGCDLVCYICSRSYYDENPDREEFSQEGVYALIKNKEWESPSAYIGISGKIIQWQERDWTQVVCFSAQSREDPFNLTMSRHIAAGLSDFLTELGYRAANSHAPHAPGFLDDDSISREDRMTCNVYLDAIRALWSHIGINIEDADESEEAANNEDEHEHEDESAEVNGEGEADDGEYEDESVEANSEGEDVTEYENGNPYDTTRFVKSEDPTRDTFRDTKMENMGEIDPSITYTLQSKRTDPYKATGKPKEPVAYPSFVVFEGSTARLNEVPSLSVDYRDERQRLIHEGVLKKKGDVYVFTKNHPFPDPHVAGSVVKGCGSSGYDDWKDDKGRTLGQNLNRQKKW